MDIRIASLDRSLESALRNKIDRKTKPPGSLGRLEELALQLGLIQNTLEPYLAYPHMLVCAGDHGAAKAGVSAYPQEVTWQMVENFLTGGAAINVLSWQAGMELVVADAGVVHDFGARPGLVDAKVAPGTASYLEGPAMSPAQRDAAMAQGAALVRDFARAGCNVLGFGEMGIGNTASASLITHCLTGAPLAECVGRGTGLDDAGLSRKRALLVRALDIWDGPKTDPLAVLARYGGFEIAMLAGAMLSAAQARMVLLIDGFIATSALLVAQALQPAVIDHCVFAHRSGEPGHSVQLAWLHARPLLELNMRLGEGTGAALAYPLLVAACAFLNEMASFESAGVTDKP
ncbi:MAG: nicotinate-nucleotide--dimethylbenzimidazole phosphoribosyltransferase [Candidatus Nitricoxidivorans perseverans]|uniref:Nicotinate-nucleotide--dimethylbenzimidazole phosphoribosyltransferase n=1 Tax=Candidatus Nitricoxidivorans perseverans TaxID=2975601 RepID=A0AA49FJZ7_9PROT|nr:MAG: nicotinate-nucleotide--dimethylbenzimidazole phosphoribosyltransferase [Candidatus Nitricoxidivorans perseverans]